MKTRILKNTTDLLKLIYPVIITWAQECDYSIPSITWLSKYTVKFIDCESYESTYNGDKIEAIGSHQSDPGIIKVASKRDHRDVLSTLVHEFAHAVQFFNLGAKFSEEYSAETKINQHSSNRFENEARLLQRRHSQKRIAEMPYRDATGDFEFKFMPKPGPKPAKKTPKKTTKNRYSEYSWGYEARYVIDYSGTLLDPKFKVNRGKWWLYR